jgi:diguanylate cyclase (GGDEF)-like protein
MRLTGPRVVPRLSFAEHPRRSRAWLLVTLAALLLIYALDRQTGAAPVQHLYYLPIVFAAIRFGGRGGVSTAIGAIVLYHLANPHVWSFHAEEPDAFQMIVFVAVGAVAARLASDSRRLHRLAMTDDLTGLHNLRSFELHLRPMIVAAAGTAMPLALLVLDVDRLKSLNDAHGHLAGAEAVRTVGEVLAARMPAECTACRYGGDEFVIAIPRAGPPEAVRIAEELCQAVHGLAPVLAGVAFSPGALSISVGVACRTFESASVLRDTDIDATGEALFRAADTALYAAKRGGRNRISLADGEPRSI